jgi:putative peptidoglycan lipid II flippase
MSKPESMSVPAFRRETAKQVISSSAVVIALRVLGFASALLVDLIVAMYFGLGNETDAFFIAFSVPQLTGSILLVALRAVLVPVFTKVVVAEGKPSLWRVSSNLANMSLLGLGAFGIIGSLSSPWIVRILGLGLSESARPLAVSLSSLLFWMVIPLGTVEVLKAVLNSLHSFALPEAGTAIRNSAVAMTVFLCVRTQGIFALAAGYVVAAWIQLVFLTFVLFAKGFRYHPVLQWQERHTREALRQIRYPLSGSVLGQSTVLVERFLASLLPVGVVSALAYARRILRAVEGIFLGGISTALLPDLSAQFTQRDMSRYRESLVLGLKLTSITVIPVVAGIVGLSEPIVRLLFQRGAFGEEAVVRTSQLLTIYVLSIPPMAFLQMLTTSYYAAEAPRAPFYVKSAELALNITLDIVLFRMLGAAGLALAFAVAKTVTMAGTGWLLYRRIGSLGRDFLVFASRIVLSSLIMSAVLFVLQKGVFDKLTHSGILVGGVQVFAEALIGIGVYVLLLLLFRVVEKRQITETIRNYRDGAQATERSNPT